MEKWLQDVLGEFERKIPAGASSDLTRRTRHALGLMRDQSWDEAQAALAALQDAATAAVALEEWTDELRSLNESLHLVAEATAILHSGTEVLQQLELAHGILERSARIRPDNPQSAQLRTAARTKIREKNAEVLFEKVRRDIQGLERDSGRADPEDLERRYWAIRRMIRDVARLDSMIDVQPFQRRLQIFDQPYGFSSSAPTVPEAVRRSLDNVLDLADELAQSYLPIGVGKHQTALHQALRAVQDQSLLPAPQSAVLEDSACRLGDVRAAIEGDFDRLRRALEGCRGRLYHEGPAVGARNPELLDRTKRWRQEAARQVYDGRLEDGDADPSCDTGWNAAVAGGRVDPGVASAELEGFKTGAEAATADFWKAVRRGELEKARRIVAQWPGGPDPRSGELAAAVARWDELAGPAEPLLAAPVATESIVTVASMVRKLEEQAPAGFDCLAQGLIDKLRQRISDAVDDTHQLLRRARSVHASLMPAVARAAERAAIPELEDSDGAQVFVDAFVSLGDAIDRGNHLLRAVPVAIDVLPLLRVELSDLSKHATVARKDWWRQDELPAPACRWTEIKSEFQRLAKEDVQTALRFLEQKSDLVGWEEMVRRERFSCLVSQSRDLVERAASAELSEDSLVGAIVSVRRAAALARQALEVVQHNAEAAALEHRATALEVTLGDRLVVLRKTREREARKREQATVLVAEGRRLVGAAAPTSNEETGLARRIEDVCRARALAREAIELDGNSDTAVELEKEAAVLEDELRKREHVFQLKNETRLLLVQASSAQRDDTRALAEAVDAARRARSAAKEALGIDEDDEAAVGLFDGASSLVATLEERLGVLRRIDQLVIEAAGYLDQAKACRRNEESSLLGAIGAARRAAALAREIGELGAAERVSDVLRQAHDLEDAFTKDLESLRARAIERAHKRQRLRRTITRWAQASAVAGGVLVTVVTLWSLVRDQQEQARAGRAADEIAGRIEEQLAGDKTPQADVTTVDVENALRVYDTAQRDIHDLERIEGKSARALAFQEQCERGRDAWEEQSQAIQGTLAGLRAGITGAVTEAGQLADGAPSDRLRARDLLNEAESNLNRVHGLDPQADIDGLQADVDAVRAILLARDTHLAAALQEELVQLRSALALAQSRFNTPGANLLVVSDELGGVETRLADAQRRFGVQPIAELVAQATSLRDSVDLRSASDEQTRQRRQTEFNERLEKARSLLEEARGAIGSEEETVLRDGTEAAAAAAEAASEALKLLPDDEAALSARDTAEELRNTLATRREAVAQRREVARQRDERLQNARGTFAEAKALDPKGPEANARRLAKLKDAHRILQAPAASSVDEDSLRTEIEGELLQTEVWRTLLRWKVAAEALNAEAVAAVKRDVDVKRLVAIYKTYESVRMTFADVRIDTAARPDQVRVTYTLTVAAKVKGGISPLETVQQTVIMQRDGEDWVIVETR